MTRTWSKTPNLDPGEEGWFFHAKYGAEGGCEYPVRWVGYPAESDGELWVLFSGGERHPYMNVVHLYPNGEWLGPITPADVARADAYEDLTEGGHVTLPEGASVRGAPPLTATTDEMGRSVQELRMTPGEIKPLTATAIADRAQHESDARVGRMLREIREALVERGTLHVAIHRNDGGESLYIDKLYAAGHEGAEALDALERAHAEVCGECKVYRWKLRCTRCRDTVGVESPEAWVTPSTCAKCGAAMAVALKPPAPAKPDDAAYGAAPYCMTVSELSQELARFRDSAEVWVSDSCGQSNEVLYVRQLSDGFVLLVPGHDTFGVATPAPAKPDYASMSDEELCAHAGMPIDGFVCESTIADALRAALIALLESREQ